MHCEINGEHLEKGAYIFVVHKLYCQNQCEPPFLWRSWVMLLYSLWSLIVPFLLPPPFLNGLVKLLIWSILNFFHLSLFSLLSSDKQWWGGGRSELSVFCFFFALGGPLCHLEWCNLYHSSGSAIPLSIAVDSISLSFKWIPHKNTNESFYSETESP